MYILYESYTDECMNSKDLTMNTKIIALYNTEEQAVEGYNNHLDKTITQSDKEYDWFTQEISVDLLENANIINACRVYNGGIEVCEDCYLIALEKMGVFDNAE